MWFVYDWWWGWESGHPHATSQKEQAYGRTTPPYWCQGTDSVPGQMFPVGNLFPREGKRGWKGSAGPTVAPNLPVKSVPTVLQEE